MSATPRASANQRIGGQACGVTIDPVRCRACPPFNVNDHDFTIGRNQYHHDRAPFRTIVCCQSIISPA